MTPHPASKNMLPHPSSPAFPAALKARRELLGMSRAALAHAANIHEVMPRRYEEPDCGTFARPRPETTWLALNRALGYEIPDVLVQDCAQLLYVEKNGMLGSGPIPDKNALEWSHNDVPVSEASITSEPISSLLLKDASLENIVRFLHSKNIEPTFRHLLIKRSS